MPYCNFEPIYPWYANSAVSGETVSHLIYRNLPMMSTKMRVLVFVKLYWRAIIITVTPLVLLPLVFVGHNYAYRGMYVFLLSTVFLLTDALPACVSALMMIGLVSVLGILSADFLGHSYIWKTLLDTLGGMMMIVAVEQSEINKRIATKLLIIFGCSHYRLSFLVFFISMFISMWISNIIACCFMMPIVKATLVELDKIGIVDMYVSAKNKPVTKEHHEAGVQQPSDITIFYFLGLSYSVSVGGMTTLSGSQTNKCFKHAYESLFPIAPKLEHPHFALLSLPGVIILEAMLYLWLNFSFLGMFRGRSDIALQLGMTEEELIYVKSTLIRQYDHLGGLKFQEIMTAVLVIFGIFLHAFFGNIGSLGLVTIISCPLILILFLFFILPKSLDFLNFFKKDYGTLDNPLPKGISRSFLNWKTVESSVYWNVLITVLGGSMLMESMEACGSINIIANALYKMYNWPAMAHTLVVIIISKIGTEFAPNIIIVHSILPRVAKLSVINRIHPYYLLVSALLGSSLPFHLATGTPCLALVAQYVHIPPWKMMSVGVVPSLIAVVVLWLTITLWSPAVWTDINAYPRWADVNNIMV